MKHLGDITKLQGAELPPVDVVVGGSPCQNLSVAGNRMGLEGSESRLFYDYVRVVKEMRDADRAKGRTDEFIRPRYLVFENVFGALNSNKGKDFQIILTEIARVARPDCPDVPIPERGGGPNQGASLEWASSVAPFPSPGDYTTDSFGEMPSMTTREIRYSEGLRNGVSESHLSQILEDCPLQKYYLSARACQGILKRAERRKKRIPLELEAALRRQAGFTMQEEMGGGWNSPYDNWRSPESDHGLHSDLCGQRTARHREPHLAGDEPDT